jgi:hypothetical protein
MSRLTINGMTFDGDSIVVVGGRITVDGVAVTVNDAKTGIVEIRIVEGVLGELRTDASVKCGNVAGSVKAGGSIQCENVGGNVSAGGSVKASAAYGPIKAGGSVKIG